jgi:hypothetical protein
MAGTVTITPDTMPAPPVQQATSSVTITPDTQQQSEPWYSKMNSAIESRLIPFLNKPETRAAMSVAMPMPAESAIEQVKGIPGAISDAMPAAKLAKASSLFQEVEGAIGDNIVPTTDKMKSALDAVKEQSSLGGGGGSIADKIMTRLSNTDEGPLTYREARIAHSNLGDLTTSDKMASNPKMLRLLAQLRDSLGESIENTAQQGGKLQQYKDAMKGYAVGSQQQEKLDAIVDWAKKIGVGAIGTTMGGGLARSGWELYQKLFGDRQ